MNAAYMLWDQQTPRNAAFVLRKLSAKIPTGGETMKKQAMILLLLVLLISGCTRLPAPGATTSPLKAPLASTPAPTPQTPSATGSAGTPGPSMIAGAVSTAALPRGDAQIKAMRRDIDLLITQSQEQQGHEQNYRNQKKEQYLTVERVSEQEMKFAGKPQVFKGDYTNRFTANSKYRYYQDAAAGGKRAYNVKDNYGVWISFRYQDPNFK
jgi:hypothetical protein